MLYLADALDVDLVEALQAKMAVNERRYPEGMAQGRADKYDRLGTADS